MKRFAITKIYNPRHPNHYWWVLHELMDGAPLPNAATCLHDCLCMGSHILDMYDTLVDSFHIIDDTYEVVVQDSKSEQTIICNEGEWAIAALTHQK